MASKNPPDYGAVLTLSGVGGIATSYQASSNIPCGSATFLKCRIAIVTDPLSVMTGVTVKVQGIYTAGGSDACDVYSYRLDTNASQPELTHSYSGLAPGATVNFLFECKDLKGLSGGAQVLALATFSGGGSAKAGDSVTVNAFGW